MPSKLPSNTSPLIAETSVTHVLYSGLGGHSAVLFALLDGGFMLGARHRVLFVGVEPPLAEYIHRCEVAHIFWRYLPKISGKAHLKFILTLRRQLIADNPDMLFLHGLAAMPAVALLKLSRSGCRPFVLVRETQANHLKSRTEWISLILAHHFAQRVVHLTTEAAQGAARRLRGFTHPAKVTIVPNGLDTDFFSPSVIRRRSEAPIRIGMQSRLQPNKDHATLLAAFAQICKRHPDRRFELHIAGEGSTYSAIEQMTQRLGLVEITTMHGMLDQARLQNFLISLDIYVHCTHGETMSTAIMQALACGLPVIASNVDGVSNMVTPEAGVLYEPGNASDLADKLDTLIYEPDEAEKWRQRARHHAVNHYAIAATVNAYQALVPT